MGTEHSLIPTSSPPNCCHRIPVPGNSLPDRTQGQIDRIIEFVDEYEACDDELRQIIYKAFGASV